MEKSFTLAQVLSTGAVGLLTGLVLSHTLLKQKSANAPITDSSKGRKANEKKKVADSRKKEKVADMDHAKLAKPEQIEEDSEMYSEEDEEDDFTEEESEDEENEDLAEFDLNEEYKMVLVVRSDLGMGKGKAAAQCCHATLANYKELSKKSPKTLTRWEYCGQAKVTLKVDNEEDMLLLQAHARNIGLAAHSIRDAGRTQIAAGSRTVLAVGPGPRSVVDSITGKLKLY
ncbi:Peptidyl-tRNA hydrolase protein 2, mitochondrial [Mortierella polycephala]|uniref:peptidyl-tRNA hydrolase n=1 Tax=Mortierella polycephala TaxID=41804 RepID=A0A9P6TYE9_9FUNG|nr:Peptidyl-tRNA hydrolase protein 2, mitochondrial [Mortierella polycephala]